MANICCNKLVITGNRISILDLILSKKLHYKKNQVFEINTHCFCVPFSSDWYPPVRYFVELSKQYPDIQFKLFYLEGLTQRAGLYCVENGESEHFKKSLNQPIDQLSKIKASEIFYELQTLRSA